MPGPSSATASQAQPSTSPCESRTLDPSGATRTALSSRFVTARLSTSRSPCTIRPGTTAVSSSTARAAAAAANSSRASSSSAAERDGLAAGGRRVEAGEREQVVGQPRHPVDRALDHRGRRRAALVGRLGVGQREVEVRLDDRERRAQLVRRVGDEAPLRREGEVEPREHRVERVREPLQLVVRPVELDPARELARLDLARDARDVRDRRQHPAGDHPADGEAGDEERRERADREACAGCGACVGSPGARTPSRRRTSAPRSGCRR